MKFNPSTGELKTDDDWTIKKLHCPLQKRWEEMTPIAGFDRKRLCNGCGKHVHDIDGMSGEQVLELMQHNRDACVSLSIDSPTLTIEGVQVLRGLAALEESCPLRRIRTARGAREINELASTTLRPLIVEVPRSSESLLTIWQHAVSGRIAFSYSRRFAPDEVNEDRSGEGHWREVEFQPQEQPRRCGDDGLPIAAYMIPSDLRIGDRVWIEDIIEDVVEVHGPGHDRYHQSAVATWLGESFRFEVDEPSRAVG